MSLSCSVGDSSVIPEKEESDADTSVVSEGEEGVDESPIILEREERSMVGDIGESSFFDYWNRQNK